MIMESEKLKESLLVNLKSVTQSSKGGIPLNRLQNDYKELIGTTIPFAHMGYKSLEEFIQDIPHVVKLKRTPNGIMFAEAVSDASTAHLADLISKQKGTTSRKGFKASVPSKRYGFHNRNIARNQNSAASSSNSSITSAASSYRDQEIEDLKSELEKEKEITKELTSQMKHVHGLLKTEKDSLIAEREVVQKLKNQLESLDEIEDLKSKLKKEKVITKEFSSQMMRMNDLLKTERDSLTDERIKVQKLRNQLESLKVSSSKSNLLIDKEKQSLLVEVETLKSNLVKERKINKEFSSQMIRLNSLVKTGQDSLSAEQEMVKKLLGVSQGSSDNSVQMNCDKNTNIQNTAQSMNNDINLIKTNTPRQLKPMNATSAQEPCQMRVSQPELVSVYQQQSKQMQEFQNQLKLQEQQMKMHDIKIQQQQQQFQQQEKQMKMHNKKIQQQEQQFQKLHDQVKNLSFNAIGMEYTVEGIIKQLQSNYSTLESETSASAIALSNLPSTSSAGDHLSSGEKSVMSQSEVIPEMMYGSTKYVSPGVSVTISKKKKRKKKKANDAENAPQ